MTGGGKELNRPLRMGMVGGGPGAFIGEVHRKASRMDGGIVLTAGAFDEVPENSKAMGRLQHICSERAYGTWREMVKKESALPDDKRIDFVSICVPNFLHFPIARDFLEAGFHVVCEKPMTLNVKEARQLREIVRKSGRVFALTHNYTGYPMVKLARDMARGGKLGRIVKIVVRYPQGWLAKRIEVSGQRQAAWRTNPKMSGISCCMGDIGTHAENLAEYVTGLKISEICADLTTFAKGRRLDDDGNCLLRFDNGAKGLLFASQISVGEENNLGLWIYGTEKALEWHQEHPNELLVKSNDAPLQVWRRGNGYVAEASAAAARATRLPAGHPEAFIEAFANVYQNAAEVMRARILGVKPDPLALDFPGVDDGLRGMIFIETVVKSAKLGAKWVKMPKI
jgi:predicted dehydrogenase